MNDELEKIIRSYKITLVAFCFIVVFMICLFSWVVIWQLPRIVRTAVNDVFQENLQPVTTY